MINKILGFMVRKLVTVYYKRTGFLTYSWGFDECTDLHIISEDFAESYHRFGLRRDDY